MSKEKAILFTVIALLSSFAVESAFAYDLYDDIHRTEIKKRQEKQQAEQQQEESKVESDDNTGDTEEATEQVNLVPKTAKDFYSFVPMKDLYIKSFDSTPYYSNPTMKSAIYRYKTGNYTGSLQELYAYIKIKPNDAYAYYYMGLNYTKIGKNDIAQKCFQKCINCKATGRLLEMAVKGRDCLSGGIYCKTPINPTFNQAKAKDLIDQNINKEDAELDAFINAPYTGHGFSPALEREYQQQQLNNLQRKLNRQDNLNRDELEDIKEFEKRSSVETGEVIAMAANIEDEPSNEEILDAIDVLRRAGLNISASPAVETAAETVSVAPQKARINPADYVNPEYETINMMLGNNNNNNNDPMMTMLPYMIQNNENGKNIDPQMVQAMVMSSMMNGLTTLNSSDNK